MSTVVERTRVWPPIVALAGLVAALTAVAGPYGALVGVATAAVWYALGTPYALAGGHVALPALFPDGIDPFAFAVVELAFLAVLVGAALATSRPLEQAAIVLASALVLGGVAWLVFLEGSLALAAAALLAVVALGAYAIHRYERLRLGLLEAPSNDSRPTPPEDTDT